MAGDLERILKIEVPIIVRLGERVMTMREVTSMIPGTIIELPKASEDELELLVNNKVVGTGTAVKVGENFGLRVSYVGNVQARIEALGSDEGESAVDEDAAAMADAMIGEEG